MQGLQGHHQPSAGGRQVPLFPCTAEDVFATLALFPCTAEDVFATLALFPCTAEDVFATLAEGQTFSKLDLL